MTYATTADIAVRLGRDLTSSEEMRCGAMLEEAAIIIDSYNSEADADKKKTVSVRMILRSIGSDEDIPMGATQGSMSALGYSQSWTIGSGGASGELYLARQEKKLLGVNGNIGSYSPVQELVSEVIQ